MLSSASLLDEITKTFWFSWLKIQFNYQHHKLNYISEINYVNKLGSSPQLPSAAAAHYTLTVLLAAHNLIWLTKIPFGALNHMPKRVFFITFHYYHFSENSFLSCKSAALKDLCYRLVQSNNVLLTIPIYHSYLNKFLAIKLGFSYFYPLQINSINVKFKWK